MAGATGLISSATPKWQGPYTNENFTLVHLSMREVSRHAPDRVEQIVDQRLDELTPVQVKNIIQEMIRKHLGWLVVWGGAVGGFIGIGVSIIQ